MPENDFGFDETKDFDVLDFGEKTEEEVTNGIRYVEGNLWAKVEKTGRKISFTKDILALFRYMRDPGVNWSRKAVVVAGLIYFISPIDVIPDFIPVIGYLDDLGVIMAVLKFLGHELVPYYDPDYRA
ncbi:MAG: YkvA family protein [Ignavibacteriaceae bacterium]|nr:YkvA family protein [Ignavibacteriaceae bacterium]